MSEDTTADASGDAETTSAATRYRWTNDLLAGCIVLAHVSLIVGAVGYGIDLPGRVWDVFALEVVLATVWAFGPETVGAAKELWPGGGGKQ